MKMNNEAIARAMVGLSESEMAAIQRAVVKRIKSSLRIGSPVDRWFLERCLIEYAEEAKAGRALDEALSPRESVVFSRNYLGFYGPPAKSVEP